MSIIKTKLNEALDYTLYRASKNRPLVNLYKKVNNRFYEAASNKPRVSKWKTPPSSARTITSPRTIDTIRERSRDLKRNNPLAVRASNIVVTRTVGRGIIGRATFYNKRDKAKAKRVTAIFKKWAKSTDFDADGRINFYTMQKKAMQHVVDDGEVIVRVRNRRMEDGYKVPLQFQLLEADHIDSNKTETLDNGNKIIQGVEFNRIGKRVAYWLYPAHPAGDGTSYRTQESKRIDAEFIFHIFRQDRTGQVRGVAFGSPVVIRMKDLDDFTDMELVKQKIAASYAGYIVTSEDEGDGFEASDGNEEGDSNGTSIPDFIGAGTVEELPPGKKMEFSDPPEVRSLGEYATHRHMDVAMAYNVTVMSLNGDYSKTNYTSGKMADRDVRQGFRDNQDDIMITQFCNPVFETFLKVIELSHGEDTSGLDSNWTPPPVDEIDPAKEVKAKSDRVRNGFKSIFKTLEEEGIDDPETHLAEIADQFKLLKKLGLKMQCDPRYYSGAGNAMFTLEDEENKKENLKEDKE
jgi:lambda family phage portal protein